MKQVLEEILKAEELACKRVQQARLESERMIADARSEAQALAEDTQRELKETVRVQKQAAEKSFRAQKQEIIKQAHDQAASLRESRQKDIEPVAQKVFSAIINIEE